MVRKIRATPAAPVGDPLASRAWACSLPYACSNGGRACARDCVRRASVRASVSLRACIRPRLRPVVPGAPLPAGRARACAPARVRPSASVLRACPSVAVIRARPSGAATYILRTHHFKDPSITLLGSGLPHHCHFVYQCFPGNKMTVPVFKSQFFPGR